LGSTAVGAQYGAVSAMSFNRDSTRLLAGFAKGQVSNQTLFDNNDNSMYILAPHLAMGAGVFNHECLWLN